MEIDLSIDLESSNVDKEFASKANFTKQVCSLAEVGYFNLRIFNELQVTCMQNLTY